MDDTLTIAVALGYAIAAVEKLPTEWRNDGAEAELADMKALLKRIVPNEDFAEQFVEVSRGVLDGRGKPRQWPTLAT